MTSDVLRRRIELLEVLQVVQELVIQFVNHLFRGGLDSFEINQYAVGSQLFSGHRDFDFPVVSVKILASPFKFPQLVCAGHLGDDLEFIHGRHPGRSGSRLGIGLSALAALPVNDNARAVSVRTEDTAFEVHSLFRIAHPPCRYLERGAADHAVPALFRNLCSTLRAHLAGDFLMTMRTLHRDYSQLAFFGSLDLKGHDFLFDLGALALGAPEFHLVIF
jgi:hypothetical protein